MDRTEQKLVECFRAVFPSLTEDHIRDASPDTVEEWDSIAGVTLVTVLEEEFGLSIDPADLPELGSFVSILGYVRGRRPTAVSDSLSALRG